MLAWSWICINLLFFIRVPSPESHWSNIEELVKDQLVGKFIYKLHQGKCSVSVWIDRFKFILIVARSLTLYICTHSINTVYTHLI